MKVRFTVHRLVSVGLMVLACGVMALPTPALAFVTFESGQVRPLALSPDGTRLFAVNTPDNQLEIFTLGIDGSLTHTGAVTVGLEPVAVAAASNTEVWVVNHLSDSVSIVDVSTSPARVTRTLLVGDEPRDIVFAGSGGTRAFITTARRGQNHPNDPRLRNPSTPRSSVFVFDTTNLGTTLTGTPLVVLNLFGDTPRALAVSPDGNSVYAAVFHSGNQTTTINETFVCNGGPVVPPCLVQGVQMPGGLPGPTTNFQGTPAPETGLIVKFNPTSGHWEDRLARNWDNAVNFSLPDYDVFVIDASLPIPAQSSAYSGVGTVLFNMAVNPVSGRVYVSNTEARNEVRFEGPGEFGGSTVRGHLHESRITVLSGLSVMPRHLNKHINYATVPSSTSVRGKSLATPTGMAVTSDGATLYVAAFGSSKVGIFNTTELEADTFVPSSAKQLTIPGGGPTGLVLQETVGRLYVLTRFDNGISVFDPIKHKETQHVSLQNPEPFSVVNGRKFLYDATLTSSNGEASCSSCHTFGDLDNLAWDLGNPDDSVLNNPNPFRLGPLGDPDFHPMKGPMTTQTLRGMANNGPMHWRGDRTGGNDIGGDPLDEVAAFKKFNAAFGGLLGRKTALTDEEMQAFTDFILQVIPPPNPIRKLDNSLTPEQQLGHDFYFNTPVDGGLTCNGCHVLDPLTGKFGTDGFSTFEGEPQHFKIPHLRNVYTKVGMFGMPNTGAGSGNHTFQGDQIRGYGVLHDGSIDTTNRFYRSPVFSFPDNPTRQNVEDFVFAYDTNLAPIVGQQVTLDSTNSAVADPRIDLFLARAAVGECDVVVKGTLSGEMRGGYRTAAGLFQMDRAAEAPVSDASLRAAAATAGQELTFTAVPLGSGLEIGVDRDGDTVFDGDERDAGTDPGSDLSVPASSITCAGASMLSVPSLVISKNLVPAGDERLSLKGEWVVTPTTPAINPIANGLRLRVNDKNGAPVFDRVIPRGGPISSKAPGWKVNGAKTKWTYRDPSNRVGGGVRRIVVTDKSATTPGLFRVTLSARDADFHVDPLLLPLRLTLVLGGLDQQASGQCASFTFNPAGTNPDCVASSSGGSVTCR